MYEIEFLKAKNNSTTCRINGVLLHSSYNPEAEAKKFVDSTPAISFNPKYILIIEPALSYVIPFLKEKYPETKICAVRFLNDFQKELASAACINLEIQHLYLLSNLI